MADTSRQPGQKVGGRFTLVRPLGRGGMGEVWLARDDRLLEPVALKFLPPEVHADVSALDDLRRETARSHRLTHPNIIRIHDFQEPEGEPAFISMEFVDGQTLSALRVGQPNRVLLWDWLGPLVQQLCAALEYAHGEQVVHRDLKPSNLMLDSRGRLKLADFGIAAVLSDSASHLTLKGTSGTLAYMSPQQLAGKRPTVADDIYALGATLYELLTSKPPFYTGDLPHQILNEPPEPLNERLAGFGIQNHMPPNVAALIMACLAKDPAQRPRSAGAVAEWIGLDLGSGQSLPTLTTQVFSQTSTQVLPTPGASGVASAGAKRSRIFGIALVTLLATVAVGGGWYWATRLRVPRNRVAEVAAQKGTDENGFVPIFNGRDLSGWRANTNSWSVHDGVLDLTLVANEELPKNFSAVWLEKAHDFDLRLQCRYVGPIELHQGSIEVFFRRSSKVPATASEEPYLMRIPANPATCGAIFGTVPGSNRVWDVLVQPAQRRTIHPNDPRHHVPVTDQLNSREVVAGSFRQDWNDLEIVANGPHVLVKLNGITTAELFDEDTEHRPTGETIALAGACEEAPSLHAQFKNIRLKWLTASENQTPGSAKPGQQKIPSFEPGCRWTNSLDMVFVAIPGTKVLFSIWDTRVRDFEAFITDSGYDAGLGMFSVGRDGWGRRGRTWRDPGFTQGPNHPVCGVNWDDAEAFCLWLTKRDNAQGFLKAEQSYRLPTDAEWSLGAGEARFPWGKDWPPPSGAGNYAGEEARDANWPTNLPTITAYRDGYSRTSPVDSFSPNRYGLYDMGGNVWQWCQDWYRSGINPSNILELMPRLDEDGGGQQYRVLRGGGWNCFFRVDMRTAFRDRRPPNRRDDRDGFRCVLTDSRDGPERGM